MKAVLLFIMVVAFLVLPVALVSTAVLLVVGVAHGSVAAAFTPVWRGLLAAGGGLVALAALLFLWFGKRLVVK